MTIPRAATGTLLKHLEYFPVTGIIGPRQAGKTTLAHILRSKLPGSSIHLDLELESDLRKLDDAEAYLNRHRDHCVVIDEIQRKPSLFALLRALVDQDRRPGRFIILGSASPELIRASSETLAGRIAYTELTPFMLPELPGEIGMRTHWLRGGFPGALLAPDAGLAWAWTGQFIRTFVERDVRELGYEVPPASLRRLLSMLAHLHGGILNQSDLARSMGLSGPTISRYLDLLEGSFLIHRLQPYHANLGKRLVKSPKLYIRDSGILHYLLQIQTEEQLDGHIAVGASWEGYVIEQVRNSLPPGTPCYYYRTHTQAEADLWFRLPGSGKSVAIEIKYSRAPAVPKGFHQSIQDLQPDFRYLIMPEGESYPKPGGIEAVSLPVFLRTTLPALY